MSPNLLWLRAIKTALCLLQSSCCSWDTLPLSLGLSLGLCLHSPNRGGAQGTEVKSG